MGIASRVALHERTLAGLRIEPCQGATAILVSQHLVDGAAADGFFRDLAANLVGEAPLVSADLCAPLAGRERLLRIWQTQAETAGVPPEGTATLRARLGVELALRTAAEIEARIEAAGFEAPVQVFQSTLYRGWCTTKRP
jgi:tRNA (cmo5U34)-methyltransferase